jgi:hypothetical protein
MTLTENQNIKTFIYLLPYFFTNDLSVKRRENTKLVSIMSVTYLSNPGALPVTETSMLTVGKLDRKAKSFSVIKNIQEVGEHYVWEKDSIYNIWNTVTVSGNRNNGNGIVNFRF